MHALKHKKEQLMDTASDHRPIHQLALRHTLSRRRGGRCTESGYQLSGRCKGLSLLHHVGDENSCSRFPRFTARMRRFRRYLEAIAWFNGAGWLTLNGNFEAPFLDVGRFNSRMSRYRHSGLYSRVWPGPADQPLWSQHAHTRAPTRCLTKARPRPSRPTSRLRTMTGQGPSKR
jgi:hypothetical protein